ncbi:hypothetical protein E2542_SST09772 [Spatholobus suberectus]|nr:hypothetical protein E2542_SST09772 [Spatholobus suberectus]
MGACVFAGIGQCCELAGEKEPREDHVGNCHFFAWAEEGNEIGAGFASTLAET